MKSKFGIKEVVAIGIGTALFVALTEVQIPLGFIPNTALQPRAALMAFLAGIWPCCRRYCRSSRTCARRRAFLWKRMVELGIPGNGSRCCNRSVCKEVCD